MKVEYNFYLICKDFKICKYSAIKDLHFPTFQVKSMMMCLISDFCIKT